MSNVEESPRSEVLSVHECWRHLRSSSVGRLAFTGGAGPEIFPVNYLPEDGTLIFRTGAGTKMNALLEGNVVVLEADGLNSYGTIAWSVVVKGRPEPVGENDPGQATAEQALSPWEPGQKDYVFRISPTEVTGRSFVVDDSKRWWPAREPRPGN
ncbi:pyridoxamine 5'-phosphate oxidase family protein [Arthrobacter sp. QXT-31]|uniref:pyridoxamine 5'-phosphate oxidase family protein n=1 Tax=Arthrobacter sp. QXT-31 TaxID=1357915 RepID=UPI0009719166|nr:pyridoxamine 5'-phosphate oxidase family protein [Arthrobacter sp. QXT-31]APX01852.1 flavin-nucleotide-binding protein [Arthrobacter sp. QXT-31]